MHTKELNMLTSNNQNLILIEGAATYERILADARELGADDAISRIQDFLKIYPEFASAHNDIAVLYYRSGDMLRALAHHEKSHKLDPLNVTFRKNLADFYYTELEWSGEAIHIFLDILKDNPFDTDALNSLGAISLNTGRREQARQYFMRTLQIDPDNVFARQGLGQLPELIAETSGGKPQQQESRTFKQEIEASPVPPKKESSPVSEAESFKNLFTIESLTSSGQQSQNYQSQPSHSTDEMYSQAIKLVNAGNVDEAIIALQALLAVDANHALAHNDLGVLFQMAGSLEKSLHHHREAVRLQPESQVFRKNLADLLCIGFGALEDSLEIYIKLYSENIFDAETIRAIAHICVEADKADDAAFFLEKLLEIKPWDKDAAEALRSLKKRG